MIDAKTAHRLGIVNHIYPADRFEAEVQKMASENCDGPQVAIRAVKQTIFVEMTKKRLCAHWKMKSSTSSSVFIPKTAGRDSRLHGKAPSQICRLLTD